MNLYEQFSREELDRVKKLTGINGSLKKMRKDNIASLFSSGVVRYFRFFQYGRFLVYYEGEPKFDTEPKNILAIDEIEAVQENFEGKKGHFLVKVRSGKNLHLKSEDEDVALVWVRTIRQLIQFYKGKPLGILDEQRNWKEKADIRIRLMIAEELERTRL